MINAVTVWLLECIHHHELPPTENIVRLIASRLERDIEGEVGQDLWLKAAAIDTVLSGDDPKFDAGSHAWAIKTEANAARFGKDPLSVSALAKELGKDRKTVRNWRKTDRYREQLRRRMTDAQFSKWLASTERR